MRAATSIFRAQQILLARFDEALRPYELTFARYEALVLLRFSRTGTLPMKVIGSRLMVHPTSVTNTVERLAAAGLVVRRPNPADGRGVLASITETGRDIVERATADLVGVDFGLENISDDRLDDLYATLRDVRYAAGDVAGADQAVGNPRQ
jgi:DNA-binding MarR family transcriptional regulator